MTAKKTPAKRAAKKRATPKVAQVDAQAKKVPKSATKKPVKAKTAKAETPKIPDWVKGSPTDHIVGTKEYQKVVSFHNEKFGTDYNTWRVRPAVFYTIHQRVVSHFHDAK